MSERTEEAGLLGKLEGYGRSDAYPFHMPGHKRQIRLGITSFPNPFSVDITEIEGFDNLHRPGGILREAMERAAGIYGSEKTYFMVNGSTGGILSAVCGLTRPGDAILMARNCHKAAYHGVMLNQLRPVYVYPRQIQGWGIQGGVSAAEVEAIASLPSREELIAQIAGAISGVARGLATTINGVPRGLAQVVKAVADQKEAA